MTLQAISHSAIPVDASMTSPRRFAGLKHAVRAFVDRVNVWNPPHLKAMTVEQRKQYDDELRALTMEW